MKPKHLLWAVAILAALWSGWWALGAWQAKSTLRGWLEERRDDGWQAEWADIEVRGYPTRIDRTITDIVLADTAGGWAWRAPFFQILGLNYQKDHVILIWPDIQTIQTPWETVTLTGAELRGSVTFEAGTDKALDESTFVFRDLEAKSDAGWTASVDEVRLASRQGSKPQVHDIGLEVFGLKPRSSFVENLAKAGLVAPEVERVRADLRVTFTHPWDRKAVELARPQPQSIEIREMALEWGKVELRIAGDVTLDASGEVSGDVLVKATNWRDLLGVLRESGALQGSLADAAEAALKIISGLAGSPKTLDIPVSFENGRTKVGVIPLGPAPVIRLP